MPKPISYRIAKKKVSSTYFSSILTKLFNIRYALEPKVNSLLKLPSEPVVRRGHFDDRWFRWYHNYPLRGRISERTFHFLHRCLYKVRYEGRNGFPFKKLAQFRSYRALSRARKITFKNWTTPTESSTWMDGWISFDGDQGGLTLDFASMGHVRDSYKETLTHEGVVTFASAFNYGALGEVTIITPGEYLTPQDVEEGLRKWYLAKYKWKRGHWTGRTGQEPEWVVDVEWKTDQEIWGKPMGGNQVTAQVAIHAEIP